MEETGLDFAEWYSEQHARVHSSMLLLCGDVDLASDITDEAFARALARWARVGAMASPGGWTYRVALNLLRRRMRRRAMEITALALLPSEVPSLADHADVWEAVEALPPRQRVAVILRYVADLTEADIAEAMGVRRGTVASTLSDARRSLARFLQSDDEPDHEEVRR